ncbi:DUF1015 domain-containing protein [Crocinitomicaceae bacterium]|jgi:uncharacterized protein (DUF1015 family)|nr:DUF1015 domain-containing protein [Crocinitomicaceae bacterium]MDG1035727.1 DUF1015 domain-containing protein [Crocinitomicaceae bacterium]
MAKIRPFKAIRPTRDKVHLVATRPYYTYKDIVLKAKLEDNPYTFLHIINPEFGEKHKTEPNSNERFASVSDAYHEFIDNGILKQDKNEHIYLYRQTTEENEYMGIVAGANVQEYKEDKIKKHEATLTSREEMFMNYLNIVGYNAEPVLLSYSDIENLIEPLLYNKTKERPEYEYTTTDKVKHELWIFNKKETESIKNGFDSIDSLYICDGHHRSASSAGLKNWRSQKGQGHFPNEDYFLAFFLNERRLQILEFNRLIKTLNGLSKEEFLNKLRKNFKIEELFVAEKPSETHQITMCIEGDWYRLTCAPEIINESHPVECLDAEILTNFVLKPLLGINDLKTDTNIDFISGKRDLESIQRKIGMGKFKIGFFLYPVDISVIKRVADHNMTMPPKSTWVEPKLRSGLTIYNINE